MMSTEPQILKIQPTRDQLNKFIIWHDHVYNSGSGKRMEEFSIQLSLFEKELAETGAITLTDDYHIEHWNSLVEYNFVLD